MHQRRSTPECSSHHVDEFSSGARETVGGPLVRPSNVQRVSVIGNPENARLGPFESERPNIGKRARNVGKTFTFEPLDKWCFFCVTVAVLTRTKMIMTCCSSIFPELFRARRIFRTR